MGVLCKLHLLLLLSYSVVSHSFVTPWNVACQAPHSMGFLRKEYWSGLSFPSPENLPNPGIEPMSTAWQVNSLPLSHLGSPWRLHYDARLVKPLAVMIDSISSLSPPWRSGGWAESSSFLNTRSDPQPTKSVLTVFPKVTSFTEETISLLLSSLRKCQRF